MDTLAGRTISLRAPEPEDLDLMYLWENNPGIWHVSGTLVPFSRFILKQYLEQAGKEIFETRQLRLIICLNEGQRPMGAIDLFDFDPFHRRAGVGILIAGESDRRKGYAGEAIEVLKKYCFEVLKLHQIYCNISVDNEASLNLFTSAGFTTVGRKKEWRFNGTGYDDEMMLQCIRPAPRNP